MTADTVEWPTRYTRFLHRLEFPVEFDNRPLIAMHWRFQYFTKTGARV
jgi:hypothetical protein